LLTWLEGSQTVKVLPLFSPALLTLIVPLTETGWLAAPGGNAFKCGA
jgi:hypothetical protein